MGRVQGIHSSTGRYIVEYGGIRGSSTRGIHGSRGILGSIESCNGVQGPTHGSVGGYIRVQARGINRITGR